LTDSKLIQTQELEAKYSFFISDFTESFEKSTKTFFKEKIKLEEARIWD
jgi:hypothetical protein